MDRVNQYDFVEMGKSLLRLRELGEGTTLDNAISPLMSAERLLEDLLSGKPVAVVHCRHDAQNLLAVVQRLMRDNYYDPNTEKWDTKKNWDEQIPYQHFWGFRSAIDRFEHNLASELRGAPAYQVEDIGIFNTSALVDAAEDHIPPDLRVMVSADAKQELNFAGKAIAYGLPTAAGFHVLRATELVLEDYYRSFVGPDGKRCVSWHDYIVKLGDITNEDGKERPDKKTLRNLDQMRDLDRNPVMHPKLTYSESEAVEMFNNGTTAIMAMAREMQANAPSLPLLEASNADAKAGE